MKIIKEISNGLNYLHSNGLMHRDIKPHNILISKEGKVIICDLEVLKEIETSLQSLAGTWGYTAPDFTDEKYTEKIDIWSLGITILQMFSKKSVGEINRNKSEILQNLEEKYEYVFDICSKCLLKDPKMRISAKEIVNYIDSIDKQIDFTVQMDSIDAPKFSLNLQKNCILSDLNFEFTSEASKFEDFKDFLALLQFEELTFENDKKIEEFCLKSNIKGILKYFKGDEILYYRCISNFKSFEKHRLKFHKIGESGNRNIAKIIWMYYLYHTHDFFQMRYWSDVSKLDSKDIEEYFTEDYLNNWTKKEPKYIYLLALCYHFPFGLSENEYLAFGMFERLTLVKYPPVFYHLGCCYQYGHGTNPNFMTAKKYFKLHHFHGNKFGYWDSNGIGFGKEFQKWDDQPHWTGIPKELIEKKPKTFILEYLRELKTKMKPISIKFIEKLMDPNSDEKIFPYNPEKYASTLWFCRKKSKFYWTPYQANDVWIECPNLIVPSGYWKGLPPAFENQFIIEYLGNI